ncbi:MAG: Xaa-Pro dipeptidase [Verrucomicrobiales bacterium]|jgi:Xaa-Pro dipeptidase
MSPESPPQQPKIDLDGVAEYRQQRLRDEMELRDIAAVILTDAVNIRYATGTRNMQVFTSRNPASRYAFIPLDGPVIMFEFTGTEHLSEGLSTVQEVRHARTASFVAAGPRIAETEQAWADDIASLVTERCGSNAKIGVERVNVGAATALSRHGFDIVDAQEPIERARAIKSTSELSCIRASLRATEAAMHHMRDAISPGLTENQLWSIFHQHVIAAGADYIETRLMTAGQHTNPWFQETSDHIIEPNVLISFDTDVVGVHGYYSDFSRTFHAGPDIPTARQRELYSIAHEQVQHNIAVIQPGMTFEEYSTKAWDLPDEFAGNRYYLSAHGVGMTGEYPYLYHHQDYADFGYDGIIEPGMTLCVESYIGKPGDDEGVKLEEQILVTDSGTELLSDFPFEAELLS